MSASSARSRMPATRAPEAAAASRGSRRSSSQSSYASQSRSALGSFRHCAWNCVTCSVIASMSGHVGPQDVGVAVDGAITSVYRSYRRVRNSISFSVFSSSGYCVTGSPKSSSPAQYVAHLRLRDSNSCVNFCQPLDGFQRASRPAPSGRSRPSPSRNSAASTTKAFTSFMSSRLNPICNRGGSRPRTTASSVHLAPA